ncbi:hypothetical protein JCGZ_24305 [Jatropha curcas]|uniref:Uncharacterized protein n=1 Tax=Jatropha curcas TaxID=180498 RepID=A0A067JZG9_JATCU|nr:hypothetical protein JCGZ_24305 [Jatropha curcas]
MRMSDRGTAVLNGTARACFLLTCKTKDGGVPGMGVLLSTVWACFSLFLKLKNFLADSTGVLPGTPGECLSLTLNEFSPFLKHGRVDRHGAGVLSSTSQANSSSKAHGGVVGRAWAC